MRKRTLAIMLALAMLLALAACGTTPASSGTGTPSSGTGSAPAVSSSTAEVDEDPTPISIFYTFSGLTLPEGETAEGNPFISLIAERANVIIAEAEAPAWSDFQNRYSTLIASGDLPDVIMTVGPAAANQHGVEGAYLDLTDYFTASPVYAKYNDMQKNLLPAGDGRIYVLRGLGPTGDAETTVVRYDLLEKYNGGEFPATPQEWLEVMKALKADDPTAVPYTNNGGMNVLGIFFRAYGVPSYNGWQYTNGEAIHAFEHPMMVEAVKFHREMYEAGVLEQEFFTNTQQDFTEKKMYSKVIIAPNSCSSLVNTANLYVTNGVEDAILAGGPMPIYNDPSIDPTNQYVASTPLSSHAASISANSKVPDAAWRFIKELLSDETQTLYCWGREGEEYDVVDGAKMVKSEAFNATTYKRAYGMLFNFGSYDNILSALSNMLQSQPEEVREKYENIMLTTIDNALEEKDKGLVSPLEFINLEENTLSRKTESTEAANSILLKAITGEITIEAFEQQAAAHVEQYQFVTDEYNQKLPAVKDLLGY